MWNVPSSSDKAAAIVASTLVPLESAAVYSL